VLVIETDELYGLPFERFTAERNALAKELRGQGRREDAERVAAMRKPSQAAWAVNQLVRTQARAMASLFDAGDVLREAQSKLLAGRGDPAALRRATEREREAVGRLAELAGGLLSSEGNELTPAMLERVSETLNAAALDDEAREQVRGGCLERELRHVGLGGGDITAVVSPGKRPRAARAPETEAKRRLDEREQAERRKAARKAEADARRLAERAQRELGAAQERRDRAADKLAEAEATLDAAREAAQQAAEAVRRAQTALKAL
jgi:hypothetical protein